MCIYKNYCLLIEFIKLYSINSIKIFFGSSISYFIKEYITVCI